jgi:hypothetical protein
LCRFHVMYFTIICLIVTGQFPPAWGEKIPPAIFFALPL